VIKNTNFLSIFASDSGVFPLAFFYYYYMPHETHVDIDLGLVKVIYHGLITVKEREAAREQAARLVNEHKLNCILVDMRRCEMCLSTLDIFHFGNTFDELHFPPQLKICGVIQPDDEDDKLLETVALSRGTNIHYFTEFEQALKWLGLE
jgi:hypothetical protein